MRRTVWTAIVLFGCLFCPVLSTGTMEAEEMNHLSAKQRSIVAVAAFTAQGDPDKLETSLCDALDAGLTVNEIKEILVQMYAYAGFPRSLNGLGVFMAVLKNRQEGGITDEVGSEPSPPPQDKSSLEFGTENQTRLVGAPVRGELYEFAPAIDEFLKAHLFGDIFQRDNLDWQSREVATISALASFGGVEAQLAAHFNLGMNTGLTPEQLEDLVSVLGSKVGREIGEDAGQVLSSVLKTRGK